VGTAFFIPSFVYFDRIHEFGVVAQQTFSLGMALFGLERLGISRLHRPGKPGADLRTESDFRGAKMSATTG